MRYNARRRQNLKDFEFALCLVKWHGKLCEGTMICGITD